MKGATSTPLRSIIQRQRKITETSNKMEMKKLYQVLVVIDHHMADMPQLHKVNGALGTLGLRGSKALTPRIARAALLRLST